MTTWMKDLTTAPKVPPDGCVVLAILPRFGTPETVHWEAYPDEIAKELGEDGYWTYSIEIVADVSDGGIRPDEAVKSVWCLIDLPAELP